MKRFLSITLSSLFAINLILAQTPFGMCGMSSEDQQILKERMIANREANNGEAFKLSGAIRYIPVTYHLVAKTDGSGRWPIKNVYDNLCAINEIYAQQEIVFYLKDIKMPNNTIVYDDPSGALGGQYINQWNLQNKNSVNIFCASVANASNLGVLAFYSPQYDYIVSENKSVSSNGTTLAHEIGHYFTLAHTFYGWENTDYHMITMNCVKPTPTIVGNGNLVEYVSRTKMQGNQLLCKVAADGFCDTPADYNLGFGWNGCNYNSCAKDPEDIKLDPDEKNIMGYFLSCLEYFTAEQKAAILADYLSTKRSFLRTTTYTPKPMLSGGINYVNPKAGELVGYNTVTLTWDAVAGADAYVVDFAQNVSYSLNPVTFITKRTDTTILNLRKNQSYFWRIKAINSNSFCNQGATTSFKTTSFGVANVDINPNQIKLANLFQSNDKVSMVVDSEIESDVHLAINQTLGQEVYSKELKLVKGQQIISINNLSKGLAHYTFRQGNRILKSGKLIIQ